MLLLETVQLREVALSRNEGNRTSGFSCQIQVSTRKTCMGEKKMSYSFRGLLGNNKNEVKKMHVIIFWVFFPPGRGVAALLLCFSSSSNSSTSLKLLLNNYFSCFSCPNMVPVCTLLLVSPFLINYLCLQNICFGVVLTSFY